MKTRTDHASPTSSPFLLMRTRILPQRWLSRVLVTLATVVLASFVIFIPRYSARAAGPTTLSSSLLTLQVTSSPYAYQVIEKSTGEVLVSQNITTFTVGATSYTTASASNIASTATTLDADLALTGTANTAHVKFTFTNSQVLHIALTFKNGTPTQVKEQFNDQGEHYYGIWEYPFNGNFDNRGNDRDFLGVQGNTGVNYSSGRAPFYTTSRKYAMYAESQAQGHYTVAVNGKTSFSFNSPTLTYDVIYGPDYYAMLAQYTTIAGGAYMPPTWAFDSVWWMDDAHSDLHNATNAQGNVIDLANQLQNNHIPAASEWIDRPFGTGYNGYGNMDFDSSFPNPAQMVSDLHTRGLNLMLWIANRAWNNLYTQGSADGYLFPGNSTLGPAADLRKPNAYSWFQNQLNAYVNLGIKGYKIDRGEEGEQPTSVENQNVPLFAQVAYQGLAAKNGTDEFVFARDENDTGRKYSALWEGDSSSDFTGLTYAINAGLRSAAINFPVWGSDTGGYLRSGSAPTEELFARWLEFSAYSPTMEVLVGAGHTPWYNYDANLVNITQAQASTHHDLIPYTRAEVYKATQTGHPVMRPLAFQFPNDPNVATIADEYMYGSEYLVAPVTVAGATSHSLYLPAGNNWLNYNDKSTIYAGGQTVRVAAPLNQIPVFVKEGAIIPHGDILKSNNNWTANWAPQLNVQVFPSDTIANSFDYYTGSSVQSIHSSKSNGNMTIQFGDLGNNGNLEVYVKSFGSVIRNGTTLTSGTGYTYNATTHLLTVPFTGATTLELTNATSIFTTSSSHATISNLAVADTANAANWSVQSNLQVGNTEYGDRAFTLAGIPSSLLGTNWIRTANSSKQFTGNPTVTFTINQQADVYVAEDTRLPKPTWMDASWTDTGTSLTNSEAPAKTYELFKKTFPTGTVSLGPNGGVAMSSMYTVIVS